MISYCYKNSRESIFKEKLWTHIQVLISKNFFGVNVFILFSKLYYVGVLVLVSVVNYDHKCDATIWSIHLMTLESSFMIVICLKYRTLVSSLVHNFVDKFRLSLYGCKGQQYKLNLNLSTKFWTNQDTCSLYYKHITIINDDSRIIRLTLQIVASHLWS